MNNRQVLSTSKKYIIVMRLEFQMKGLKTYLLKLEDGEVNLQPLDDRARSSFRKSREKVSRVPMSMLGFNIPRTSDMS